MPSLSRGIMLLAPTGRGGGIGRHAVLRGPWAYACVGSNPALGTKQPGLASFDRGDVAKWTKAEVCKTSIRRFESARRLHIAFQLREALEKSGAFPRLTAVLTATGNRYGVSWPVYKGLSGRPQPPRHWPRRPARPQSPAVACVAFQPFSHHRTLAWIATTKPAGAAKVASPPGKAKGGGG